MKVTSGLSPLVGTPIGTTLQWTGGTSTGLSNVVMSLMLEASKNGKTVIFTDHEASFQPDQTNFMFGGELK